MDQKISFERFLFGDGNEIVIDDIEFCVDRIVMLPKIRPHQLEKGVRLSVEYCQIADFRRKLLEKSYNCPVLIYQLYKRCVFAFGEIEPFLSHRDTFLFVIIFGKRSKILRVLLKVSSNPLVLMNLSLRMNIIWIN